MPARLIPQGLAVLSCAVAVLGTSPAAAAQPAEASRLGCGTPLQLRLEDDFVDPRGLFRPDSVHFRETAENILAALRRACSAGIARAVTHSLTVDYLLLRNSPAANSAGFVLVSINRRRGTDGLLFDYPLVAEDGTVKVPSVAEIYAAISCRRAGSRAQLGSGRCLGN